MSQNTPNSHKPENDSELTPKQLLALESLLRGSTATEAARAAGVDRRTLFRWQCTDVHFQAAMNRGRQEMRQAAAVRLERLAESAVTTLERRLADGDARSAVAVLRGLGLLGGTPVSIGSEDAAALALEARRNAARRQNEELVADLGL